MKKLGLGLIEAMLVCGVGVEMDGKGKGNCWVLGCFDLEGMSFMSNILISVIAYHDVILISITLTCHLRNANLLIDVLGHTWVSNT